jgi:hypothetical protein
MASRDVFKLYKASRIPQNGVCPNCGKNRGMDPAMWTLIPGHMYCKYCFQLNVGDKDECKRIKDDFIASLKDEYEEPQSQLQLLIEIKETLSLLIKQRDPDIEYLLTQSIDDNVAQRIAITRPIPQIIGRYTCGAEIDQSLPRSAHMINLTAVITTPAIRSVHKTLWCNPEQPEWLLEGMAMYTTDPDEFPLYPCAYVQCLARNL